MDSVTWHCGTPSTVFGDIDSNGGHTYGKYVVRKFTLYSYLFLLDPRVWEETYRLPTSKYRVRKMQACSTCLGSRHRLRLQVGSAEVFPKHFSADTESLWWEGARKSRRLILESLWHASWLDSARYYGRVLPKNTYGHSNESPHRDIGY